MLHRVLPMLLFVAATASAAPRWQDRPAWRAEFASRGLGAGTAVVYDEAADTYFVYDRARAGLPLLPASTFKLFNALVSLETGVVRDEHEIIAWDGKDRGRAEWNRDTDLASGMRYSTVWFYRALARRIGEARMQQWIDAAGYGNRDIGGGIDRFWLVGDLRISALQQIEFLRRLAAGILPFSARSQAIVRRICLVEKTDAYELHGKTGWKHVDGEPVDHGWFVGWVERGDRRWFVAVNMDFAAGTQVARDGGKRLEVARAVLAQAGAL